MSFSKKNFKFYTLFAIVFLDIIIWSAIFTENKKDLTVAFLDVGQGDAIFIEAPNGKQILIDGGPNGVVARQLSKVMPFFDRSIDTVIMSHPDQDHIGGLPVVLENYKIDFVMESGVSADNGTYDEVEKIISEKKIKKVLARQGMIIELCNSSFTKGNPSQVDECGEYLEILFPNIDVSGFETNTASVVAKLVFGEKSFLFTGDAPESIEKYLVGSFGKKLDVDVLKLGHHGSSSSNSDLFLGFASPEYVVASVGENNRYGHPHREVVDFLQTLKIPLLRTDESGTIIFESDGVNLKIVN